MPTERERTQWYFQRYVEHLPAAGEMVLFDRSWYNRSNVEWVMGYCTEEEHQEFLRSCPEFERMLVRSGIMVLKYWFSVSFEEQRRRFEARNAEPLKRWKLSDMDLAEHELYVRYSMAKDTTFQHTDIKQAPWYVVPSDDKRAARLNCISHLLSQFDYDDMAPDVVELPDMRQIPYVRPPMHEQTFVPGAIRGRQVADLLGVPEDAGEVVGDRAQGPAVAAGAVPLVRAGRGQPQREGPGQPRQALAGPRRGRLGEARPVGVEGEQAAVPGVGLGLDAGEQRLDLGEVVDQVVGDPADRLVRRVDAVAVLAHPRPAVPVDPGVGQVEASGVRRPRRRHRGSRFAHGRTLGSRSLRSAPKGGRPTLEGMYDVDLAAVGALLGNPSRAAMLDALMTGRALTATELARAAGGQPGDRQRAPGEAARGRPGRGRGAGPAPLPPARRAGRRRRARGAVPHRAGRSRSATLRQSSRARSLAEARTCYDHLAGRVRRRVARRPARPRLAGPGARAATP